MKVTTEELLKKLTETHVQIDSDNVRALMALARVAKEREFELHKDYADRPDPEGEPIPLPDWVEVLLTFDGTDSGGNTWGLSWTEEDGFDDWEAAFHELRRRVWVATVALVKAGGESFPGDDMSDAIMALAGPEAVHQYRVKDLS